MSVTTEGDIRKKLELTFKLFDLNSNGYIDEKEIPLHFQLCIGKHVVFCTERDLKCVDKAKDVHFIVQFILQKMLNISFL